jgi:hypothetical protein
MILDPAIRRKKLAATRSNPTLPQARQKLYYKGETQLFDVFRIELDLLIYNRHNGRLDAEMLTWERERSVSPDHYDQELHNLIEAFLWNTNPTRNKFTLDDLRQKGQQRAGIVSLDGVVIDGNRRLMLLRRLQAESSQAQFFDAIILPDAYHENEREIVRLETQYQIGEDAKLEYGPLEKYLHARRLHADLGLPIEEIAGLMNIRQSEVRRLLEIADLMDDYLEHIGCPGLYTLLKDQNGTKEGMLVDLHGDLNRLKTGSAKVPWTYDQDLDVLQLKSIQFDYMRFNEFTDAKKSYREISHQGNGRNFFSHEDIWNGFVSSHMKHVDTVTGEMGELQEFLSSNPDFTSKVDAARARDSEWTSRVRSAMKGNFGKASSTLDYRVSEEEPKEYLRRALLALQKIDISSDAFLTDPAVLDMVKHINSECWEMKKALERAGA